MGTLRDDNGGGERPQDDDGLPDLPPEWGTIIIPDDPGALDDEGTSIRRQFRRATIRRRWRRRLHLPAEPARRATDDSPGLAVPLLIMSIAVIATLVSLFAVTWPGHTPHTTPHLTPASSPPVVSLAQLSVFDPAGVAIPLKNLTPAVILLVDGCSCEKLITGTVNAVAARAPSVAPPGGPNPTSVLIVATRAPTLPSGLNEAVRVRAVADPNNSLRAAVPALANDRTSAAVLVAADGTMIRALRAVTSADDFATDLPRLH
jgi:hypothetical protein